MKNEHLVPVNILDIGEKIAQQNIRENERANYLLRLEATRDYCDALIKKEKDRKAREYSKTWKSTRDYCS